MRKRAGKKSVSSFFSRKSRSVRRGEMQPSIALSTVGVEPPGAPAGTKGAKKKVGPRLWIRFDRTGQSEVTELDKSAIIQRASIPARDLRILGPVFSQSSSIMARERAMVVNLEFIKAIVTADELLLLDPLSHEVLPFVEQLRQHFSLNSPSKVHEPGDSDVLGKKMSSPGIQLLHSENVEGELELPFEFQVLELALEFVCTYLDSSAADLEKNAYPVLDELAMSVSTKNLERVRSLKSNLTQLLARVQKVRDEIEHLLDDNEDMAQLYLTRKQIQDQQFETLMASANSNSIVVAPNLARVNSAARGSASLASFYQDDNTVEDLEMLLEAYFMQLEGTRNKILSVREYIDDTEDYVNIQLDNQRNELIQLQLFLAIASFAISINTLIVGIFSVNIPCPLYNVNHLFTPFVGGTSTGSFFIFLVVLGYARWKKLLGP
ncbi:Putative magnesium transporter MRS2-G [Apostasia shenzhenica]|uniref:Magnesium transporter n=1 Tax=Apostasia shenzhenica TaxID=1088818 RepID=A0A2I0AHH2_9ASPA|nr:Putative magnesium transporter MRS2-G [Apostasia shenzhenica]